MMICLFDINATGLNTIVTIVSITCAVLSGFFTYRTSKIKKQVFKKIDAFDLVTFSREFHLLNTQISKKIRTPNSNNAGRNNKLIDELNGKLVDFNNYENKLPLEFQKGVRANVDFVLNNIGKIYEATADQDDISRWKSRLQDIDRKLIEITDKMIKE